MKATELAYQRATIHLLALALSSFARAASSATPTWLPPAQLATTQGKATFTVAFVRKAGLVLLQLLTTLFKSIALHSEECMDRQLA